MTRVHFVCVGNCCRSQMAEGFARHFGSDLLVPSSSGLAPTREVAFETVATMDAKGVDIRSQYPKKFDPYGTAEFDLIVNLSGFYLPGTPVPPVEEWMVRDPFGQSPQIYAECADDIEARVKQLLQRVNASSGHLIAPEIA